MKFFVGLLLAVAISSTVGLPARNPDDDAEFVNLNSGRDRSSSSAAGESPDFTGVVDTGIVYPGGRGSYPFSSFGGDSGVFDGISDFMRRFRENIFNRWWQNIPTFDVAELDPSKGNTTSVIKVVDGHRVEINDTVYTKTDDGGNAFYKVRVVNVRPLDSEEDGTATTAPDSDEEPKKESPEVPKKPSPEVPSRESSDNEINKSTESTTQLHESSSTIVPAEDEMVETTTQISEQVEQNEKFEDMIESFDESIEDTQHQPERKLSEKLKFAEEPVAEERYIAPLHSELSEEDGDDSESIGTVPYEWASFQEPQTNIEDNSIDDYDSIPIDLSNDIAINQMLADQGAPTNPDAEVFTGPEPFVRSSLDQNDRHIHRHPIRSSSGLYWPKRK